MEKKVWIMETYGGEYYAFSNSKLAFAQACAYIKNWCERYRADDENAEKNNLVELLNNYLISDANFSCEEIVYVWCTAVDEEVY